MDKIIAAANETETTWKNRAERGGSGGKCGWCEWARNCSACPVFVVFDLDPPAGCFQTSCSGVAFFVDWRDNHGLYTDAKAAAAGEIHQLLVPNRKELIAAARKIEEERC